MPQKQWPHGRFNYAQHVRGLRFESLGGARQNLEQNQFPNTDVCGALSTRKEGTAVLPDAQDKLAGHWGVWDRSQDERAEAPSRATCHEQ